MPTSLYIQLDFFHIGAYRAAGDAFHAEAYAHDNDYYYLVLQPFLIANSEKASSPGISEYFKTWSGATLAEPGRVVAIDETLVNALNTEGKFAATPVPFPPSTSLSLKLSMTSAPATADLTIERTLEAAGVNPTPALVLAAANWPEFAARNYLNIPIRVWDQFSDSQRSQILDWVYGLMVVLRRGADAGSLSANETSVWNRFFKSLSPADGSQKAWMPLLTAGTPPLAMQVLSYPYDPAHTGPKEKNLKPAAIHAHPGVDSPIQGGGLPEPAASDLSCAVVVQVRRSGRYRGGRKDGGCAWPVLRVRRTPPLAEGACRTGR
jgi:hypothetical protein